jgi:ubiquinone/menaquinone biosynthesis C-methylase UbiE
MVHHKFNPEKLKRFEEEPFSNILKTLNFADKFSIIDLGAGSGFHTFPIAHHTPDDAKIYALDVSDKMTAILKKNMLGGQLYKPIVAGEEKKIIPKIIAEDEFPVPENSIDLIFSSKVFHEIENHVRFIKELKRILKVGGIVYFVDWMKKDTENGPPKEHRVSLNEGKRILTTKFLEVVDSGEIYRDVYYIKAKRIP